MPITWEPSDYRPPYGPPCPGPHIHEWTLTAENADEYVTIGSGCPDCDAWFSPADGHLAFRATGRLVFEEEHPPGRCPHLGECDHGHWWRFTTAADDQGAQR